MQLETDFQDDFAAWQQKQTPQTTGNLLRKVRPVLDSAMNSFGSGQHRSTTLRSRAKRLAIDAFSTYDPQRGPLKRHLMRNLQRLQRYAGQQQQIISLPERVAMDQMRTNEASRELEDQRGRPPSDQELADFTGLSLKRLAHIRRGVRPLAEGQLDQPTASGDTPYMPATTSLASRKDPAVDIVYSELNPTDQFILERMVGFNGHAVATPGALAKRLKLTPAAISQRLQRIQARLDRVHDLSGLG